MRFDTKKAHRELCMMSTGIKFNHLSNSMMCSLKDLELWMLAHDRYQIPNAPKLNAEWKNEMGHNFFEIVCGDDEVFTHFEHPPKLCLHDEENSAIFQSPNSLLPESPSIYLEFEQEKYSRKFKRCNAGLMEFPISRKTASIPHLTHEEAFQILRRRETSCKLFLPSMKEYQIIEIQKNAILKYNIETIFEQRKVRFQERPFYPGDFLDKKASQKTYIWDIDIKMPRNRHPVAKKIPGTSSIQKCDSCSGNGSIQCPRCKGEGQHNCERCWGRGHNTVTETSYKFDYATNHRKAHHHQKQEACHDCHGAGYLRCCYCHGDLKHLCARCDGTGKIEEYTQVVAKWISRDSCGYFGYPEELSQAKYKFLDQCKCEKVFQESSGPNYRGVEPVSIDLCSDVNLVNESHKFVEHHNSIVKPFRIKNQKHYIGVIPVYTVIYEKHGKRRNLLVVGTNHQVYNSKKNSCSIM